MNSLFNPLLFAEISTFTCTFIFFMFFIVNRVKASEVQPSEYKDEIRDAKIEEGLNGKPLTKRTIGAIRQTAVNKHLLIPNCGWVSFISLILFIIIELLHKHHII